MADAKLTELTEDTTPSTTGLVYYVDDPLGSPVSRKVTISNLFSSGTYTPTLSNTTNVAASTVNADFLYMRIGAFVMVTGNVSVDPTTAAITTVLGMSLPFASNFGAATDVNGVGTSAAANAEYGGIVRANTTTDVAELQIYPTLNTNVSWRVSFMYKII